MHPESRPIIVLDFGSQYTQLIARRVRELRVYSEIHPWDISLERLEALSPAGIVLSGGPASARDPGAPALSPAILDLGVPVLGICYGLQVMVDALGGTLESGSGREYGRATIEITRPAFPLFGGLDPAQPQPVWMSHGDRVAELPPGWVAAARSDSAPVAAAWCPERNLMGLQFHPEVAHTPAGTQMLERFVYDVCGCEPGWTMASFVESQLAALRARVGQGERVISALSGGVDSSVASVLVHRAIGERLTCIFVDNGLLRAGEANEVEHVFARQLGVPLRVVDARDRFLARLAGVEDPEEKRKIIGREFIAVFEEEASRLDPAATWLVQGTLYPDVIESVSTRGPSAVIKSHHNVGGLPARMRLRLIEPLRELFKDEVRHLGEELGIPAHLLWRHPFPGPGLAVRILGEVTPERVALLQRADAIIEEEIRAADLYGSLWQAFGVLLPVRTVGVMGDRRTYESVLALRAVHSVDGMTADWARLPHEVLAAISGRVINEVAGINRVVYDISSKPPATIEWE